MLRLSRSKIYELKERIGYLKIGGAVRFREDDVLRYLDECVVQSSTQTARRSAPRT
ncbi:MAG: helix-turn-helix domain-containing protein, partial [Rhodopirellula sp.]|nr:helix-turn-helix domain-containing protein [Rhodopirellula sp.]